MADERDILAALLDPTLPCPGGFKAWNGSAPGVRFAVHRNNVMSSLIDALAATFPVVQELVGRDFFRAMAAEFVRIAPPASPMLAHYGERFPDFIARFPPARGVSYLADVACLEMARIQARDCADVVPIDEGQVRGALANAERVGEMRFACHPSLAIVRSRYAVVSLWGAHQDGGDIASVDPDLPEDALIVRTAFDVNVMRVGPGVASFVEALAAGAAYADAAARATREAQSFAQSFNLSAALRLLLAHGAICAIGVPPAAHGEQGGSSHDGPEGGRYAAYDNRC